MFMVMKEHFTQCKCGSVTYVFGHNIIKMPSLSSSVIHEVNVGFIYSCFEILGCKFYVSSTIRCSRMEICCSVFDVHKIFRHSRLSASTDIIGHSIFRTYIS